MEYDEVFSEVIIEVRRDLYLKYLESDGLVTRTDGQVAFANATGAKKYHILRLFYEGHAHQFIQLFARGSAGELEVIILKELRHPDGSCLTVISSSDDLIEFGRSWPDFASIP